MALIPLQLLSAFIRQRALDSTREKFHTAFFSTNIFNKHLVQSLFQVQCWGLGNTILGRTHRLGLCSYGVRAQCEKQTPHGYLL